MGMAVACAACTVAFSGTASASETFTFSPTPLSHYDAVNYCSTRGGLADITALNATVGNTQLLLQSPDTAWIGTLDGVDVGQNDEVMAAGLTAPSYFTDTSGLNDYYAMCNGSI